jgi:hypothetical protein
MKQFGNLAAAWVLGLGWAISTCQTAAAQQALTVAFYGGEWGTRSPRASSIPS